MEFGVDADGVGEGDGWEGREVRDDKVGDVGELDDVSSKGLIWAGAVSGCICLKGMGA